MLPLSGATVWSEGRSTSDCVHRAGRVALRQLEQLGAVPPDGTVDAAVPADSARSDVDDMRLFVRDDSGPVECRITGWGELGHGPCDETAIQAATGLMAVHGHAIGRPHRLNVDYAGTVAGVLTVHGLLAVQLARLRGSSILGSEVSVAHSALLANAIYLAEATASEEIELLPNPAGDDHAHLPPFPSADGVYFELEVLSSEAWRDFWAELGASESAVSRSWWRYLTRYLTREAKLPVELSAATSRLRYNEIAQAAQRTGVGVCRIRTVDQRRSDPDVFGPDGRIAAPWTLEPSTSMASHQYTGVPFPPDAELPLAGLRVVEASLRIQAPFAGQVLRMLGADVVRIEPPGGDPLRGGPPLVDGCSARFRTLNRGKRFVEIDIKSPAGREQVSELAREADVFLHNWAPGKASRYGLDSEHLSAINPYLVYAHASGWGDALGPTPPIGTDYLAQAYSGVASVLAEPGEPARPSLMVLTDVLGGMVAAGGILAGLLTREREGIGCRMNSSLLSATNVLLDEQLEGNPDGRRPAATEKAPPGADAAVAAARTDLTDLGELSKAVDHPDCAAVQPPWRWLSCRATR